MRTADEKGVAKLVHSGTHSLSASDRTLRCIRCFGMAGKSQTKAFLPDLVALWAPGRAAFDLYTNSAILSSKKCPVKDPF